MYTPRSFKVEEIDTLHAFMKANSFAIVVGVSGSRIEATHLPCLIDSTAGEFGTLRAHMARANPLWKMWTPDQEVLVIFTGPHGYVSPSWYQQQVTVPTWNYAAVHVSGKPHIISDTETLHALVTEQVRMYEEKEKSTWDQSLMQSLMGSELKAIVGFEIPIERIEGKFKFNQNRSAADQHGVVFALERSGCPFKKSVANVMRSLQGGK